MFTPDFIISYDNFGFTLVVDVDYPEYLQSLQKDMPFLLEKDN